MSYRVFIGNLPFDTRERDLIYLVSYDVRTDKKIAKVEKFFKGYGKMREVVVKNGFGFADFEDRRDAEDAVHDLHGKELLGTRIIVDHAVGSKGGRPRVDGPGPMGRGGGGGRGYGGGSSYDRRDSGGYRDSRDRRDPQWMNKYGPPNETPFRVIVENLSSKVSWQDLKDFMRQAGQVTYADAHRPDMNVGVVCFQTRSEMKRALDKFDGEELHGRRIKLIDDYRGKRSPSNDRSRSRSRSSRRSRSATRSRSR